MRISSTSSPSTVAPKSSAQNVPAGDKSFAGIFSEASTRSATSGQIIEGESTAQAENELASGVAGRPLKEQTISSSVMLQTPAASPIRPSNTGSNPTTSEVQLQADQHTANRQGVERASLQLRLFDRNDDAVGTAVIPQPVQMNPSEVEKSPALENGSSPDGQPGRTPERVANTQDSKDAAELPSLPASKAQPDALAAKQSDALQSPTSGAPPQDAVANDDSAALFDSSGMPNLFAGLVGINTEPLLLQPIELPIASAHSNTAGGVLKNAAQDAGTDPLNPRNSTSASPSNSGTSKAEAGAANSFDAPIHGVQGSNADLSQSDAHAPRVSASDLSPLQVQTAVNQSVSPEATATPRSAAHTSEGFHTGVHQEASASVETDNVEAMAASAISTAKLMQTMSETEMRVGISSSDFGDISIRTSVSNHQMLAQISVDHSELSQVISAHASSVQAKLGDEYGLQTLIEINNVASSNSSEQGQSSQQGGGTPSGSLTTEDIAAPAEEEIGLIPGAILVAGTENRLDIRA